MCVWIWKEGVGMKEEGKEEGRRGKIGFFFQIIPTWNEFISLKREGK